MFNKSTKLDRMLTQCIQAIEEKGWTIEGCLDRYARDRVELKPMLRTALRLRQARSFRPSIEFRSNAQSRFRARLNTSRRSPWLSKSRTPAPQPGILESLSSLLKISDRLQWAAPLLLIMIFLISTGGGVAYAADHAKPGDALYQVDRAIENFRINLENDKQQAVRLHLMFAEERLEEAFALIQEGDITGLKPALDGYKEQIIAAAPLIAEAYAAGEDVIPLVYEGNEAITAHEKKLEDLIKIAPVEVEVAIRNIIKDAEEIRIVAFSPTPYKPIVKLTPLPLETDLYAAAPVTSRTPRPTTSATSAPVGGPTNTLGVYASPSPTDLIYGTPTPTLTIYDTQTPYGTITPTLTGTITPPTPTPTRTPTPTGTPDGQATSPPKID